MISKTDTAVPLKRTHRTAGFFLAALLCLQAVAYSASVPYAHRSVSRTPFVAFDTETTGLNPKNNQIVEIAAVKYLDGKVIEKKTWLVNPGKDIPWWSTKIHGITTAMVHDEKSFAEVYPEFLQFIEGSVLIAHNAPFDIAFVRAEAERANLPSPPNRVLDSLALFRRWFPGLSSYNLASIAEHVQADEGEFHRALADSAYIASIFREGAARNLSRQAKLSDLYRDAGGPILF